MASAADEAVYYESDPEELKRSLRMRRREASDDEGEGDAGEKMGMDRRAWMHSDELDGQGGVAEYDDDNEELDAEELEEEEEEADEEEDWKETEEEKVFEERGGEAKGSYRGGVDGVSVNIMRKELEGNGKLSVEVLTDNRAEAEEEEENEEGEEKGENEPFAVPTAGAFYMHDDRFRDNNGGRNRRMRGGRRLWESKDERKWGHDKFEELSLQEKPQEEGRRTKGRYGGRGKIRGTDRGYARGNRFRDNEYNNNNSQSHVTKSVKGRNPKRYEPITKNLRHAPSSQSKYWKHPDKVSDGADKAFAPSLNAETEIVAARKQVFGSSLNSASPPFYPSGSLNKGIAITQNKDVQTGGANKNLNSDDSFSVSETPSIKRGKAIAEPGGNDRLCRENSTNPAPGKPLLNVQMPLPRSSIVNHSQPAQSKTQSRGHTTGSASYQSSQSSNQVNRVSASNHPHSVQPSSVHRRGQHAMHAPSQQLGQHLDGRSQTSSPPKLSLSIKSFEGEVESPSELSTSKSALVGKGKVVSQNNGRGSFVYGSAQVMGATGSTSVSHGDPNFPATPAFLPVMQFGGQHRGGIGVPAVGMAFPGYVAQSKLGLGSSEMTWLPVLAGAAGPLGAQYCSSYIAVDGSYNAHPPGQMSVPGTSSRDSITNKPNNEWKPSKRSELANNEFGWRQNKPRRPSSRPFVISRSYGALWAAIVSLILSYIRKLPARVVLLGKYFLLERRKFLV